MNGSALARRACGCCGILTLAVVASAGRLAGQDPVDAAELAAQVEARENAFARTMADRDFDAFLTFVSEEAVFFNGEVPLRGRDAVGAVWRRLYDGAEAPFSWEPDRVEVLESGDLALSTGPVRNVAGEVVARFNSIWRLEGDGRWRVVFDKGCSDTGDGPQ